MQEFFIGYKFFCMNLPDGKPITNFWVLGYLGGIVMGSMHLLVFSPWLQRVQSFLPVVVGLLSIAILLGCAIATWIAPAEDEDCLFHREVY